MAGVEMHPHRGDWVITPEGKARRMTKDEKIHFLAADFDFTPEQWERWKARWIEVHGAPYPLKEPLDDATKPLPPPSPDDIGWVYFVHAPEVGRVKIGFTRRPPEVRLAAHQVSSPVLLELLGAIEVVRTEEFALHRRFRDYRYHGEWFRLEGELAEFVAETVGSKVS